MASRKPRKHHPRKDTSALDLVIELMAIPGQSGQEAAVMQFIASDSWLPGPGKKN